MQVNRINKDLRSGLPHNCDEFIKCLKPCNAHAVRKEMRPADSCRKIIFATPSIFFPVTHSIDAAVKNQESKYIAIYPATRQIITVSPTQKHRLLAMQAFHALNRTPRLLEKEELARWDLTIGPCGAGCQFLGNLIVLPDRPTKICSISTHRNKNSPHVHAWNFILGVRTTEQALCSQRACRKFLQKKQNRAANHIRNAEIIKHDL